MNSNVSISTDFELICRIKKLSWLSESQAAQLVREFPGKDYKRKDVVFESRPSAANRQMYVLLSGRVNLVSYGRNNGGTVVAMVPPGVIPNLPVFSAPVAHNYQCKAAVNCRVMKITRRRFVEVCFGVKLSDDLVPEETVESMCGNSGDLYARYRSFLGLDLLTRVCVALLELAENFGVRDNGGVIIPHFFSHDDLADLVGASRPRVSSTISSLERQQIVGHQGRHMVVDTSVLRDFIAAHA